MDVQPMTAPHCGSIFEGLDGLIETVGTPQFLGAFLRASQAVLGSSHVAAFAIGEDPAPQIILATDRDAGSLAYSATNTFVNRFWGQDPINRKEFSKIDLDRGVIIRMPANEFQSIPYRRACYSASGWSSGGINLIERLSLLRQCRDRLIRIDFYRPRENGAFLAKEMKRISTGADLLLALVARHARGMVAPQTIKPGPGLENLIRQIAPDLPQREVQVCAGIVLGQNSEAIANTLGIGINTVLTYRKRAYTRLHISSHNELLRAVYAALPAVDLQDKPWQPPRMPVQTPPTRWQN